jgi:hypothetical protein
MPKTPAQLDREIAASLSGEKTAREDKSSRRANPPVQAMKATDLDKQRQWIESLIAEAQKRIAGLEATMVAHPTVRKTGTQKIREYRAEIRYHKRALKELTAPARTPAATFSVMLQLPDDPRFSIPGMMYGPAATGLQRDEALALAKKTQGETGRHVRVYVDGRNYDTADFGPRPVGYSPRSLTAKILPGVSRASGTKRDQAARPLSRELLQAIYYDPNLDDNAMAVVREFEKHKVSEIQAWLLGELTAKGWGDKFKDDIRALARDKAGLIEWASDLVYVAGSTPAGPSGAKKPRKRR